MRLFPCCICNTKPLDVIKYLSRTSSQINTPGDQLICQEPLNHTYTD